MEYSYCQNSLYVYGGILLHIAIFADIDPFHQNEDILIAKGIEIIKRIMTRSPNSVIYIGGKSYVERQIMLQLKLEKSIAPNLQSCDIIIIGDPTITLPKKPILTILLDGTERWK